MASAKSKVRNDCLAEYHAPEGTKLPQAKFSMASAKLGASWAPMVHNRYASSYNPLTHKRTDFLISQGADDTVVLQRRDTSDESRPPGNYVSAEAMVMHNRDTFHRKKGVTDFSEQTHCFKSNFNGAFGEALQHDPKVFYRNAGAMVTWMDKAISGKNKIPFRKTQPPGVA
mmetsp:Transcript_58579/g.127388  ORF Transcript_58579/g.127388 Transcript_58579/m.127388 type:complete len:171 (-) Transcript_58579:121-633(-)